MQWDELLLLASALLLVYAIVRRVIVTALRRNRVPRETLKDAALATWYQFRADGLRGEEMILLACVIPATQLAAYYFALSIDFGNAAALQVGLARPAVFTLNLILAIYFLNGRLTRLARGWLDKWNLPPHS